jgi:hypothetical protein
MKKNWFEYDITDLRESEGSAEELFENLPEDESAPDAEEVEEINADPDALEEAAELGEYVEPSPVDGDEFMEDDSDDEAVEVESESFDWSSLI